MQALIYFVVYTCCVYSSSFCVVALPLRLSQHQSMTVLPALSCVQCSNNGHNLRPGEILNSGLSQLVRVMICINYDHKIPPVISSSSNVFAQCQAAVGADQSIC